MKMLIILYFVLCCLVSSLNAIRCDNKPSKRGEINGARQWPKEIIPYEIDSVFTDSEQQKIRDSLKDLMTRTNKCVRFVDHTKSDTAWVKVVSRKGYVCKELIFDNKFKSKNQSFVRCASGIGMVSSKNEVSLNRDDCLHKGTIQHEFMHVLGFGHEQNRSDREKYVNVLYENIQSGRKSNKSIINLFQWNFP